MKEQIYPFVDPLALEILFFKFTLKKKKKKKKKKNYWEFIIPIWEKKAQFRIGKGPIFGPVRTPEKGLSPYPRYVFTCIYIQIKSVWAWKGELLQDNPVKQNDKTFPICVQFSQNDIFLNIFCESK